MQSEVLKRRLANIQTDPATREFQDAALAQLDALLDNPPLHGETVLSAESAEYQRISPDAKDLLEKNSFISLLLVMANFITNLYRYMYFGYAQPGETEEEAISRGKLRAALLAAIVEDDYVVSTYHELVFNKNFRYAEWKVFPDSETREEQIRSAQVILEVWQALIFPEGMYPQNTMFSQGQEDFFQAQLWDMQEVGDTINTTRFAKIKAPAIEARLQFLYWLVENNQTLPKPDLTEAKMLYSEILLRAEELTRSAKQ